MHQHSPKPASHHPQRQERTMERTATLTVEHKEPAQLEPNIQAETQITTTPKQEIPDPTLVIRTMTIKATLAHTRHKPVNMAATTTTINPQRLTRTRKSHSLKMIQRTRYAQTNDPIMVISTSSMDQMTIRALTTKTGPKPTCQTIFRSFTGLNTLPTTVPR